MEINVCYNHENPNHYIKQNANSDWIDLYTTKFKLETDENWRQEEYLHYKAGDVIIVDYGFATRLPLFHEALIAPRSSTFQNTGLLLTNSPSIIDNSYNSPDSVWLGKFYATRDGYIQIGQRLTQFRVQENQPRITFIKTAAEDMPQVSRGGYGSTGK